MFELIGHGKEKINILNGKNIKLFKVFARSETATQGGERHAQIKIIIFNSGILSINRKGCIYPEKIDLTQNNGKGKKFEITYHGPTSNKTKPIIHLKDYEGTYTTIIEKNFPIKESKQGIVPILSFFDGHLHLEEKKEESTRNQKKEHYLSSPTPSPVRIDLYASSQDFDLDNRQGDIYNLSLFCSPDYMDDSHGNTIEQSLPIGSIKVFKSKNHFIYIKFSNSSYNGAPLVKISSNESHREDFTNRPSITFCPKTGKTTFSRTLE